MTAPYRASALDYWAVGWRGILPLPLGLKAPPPNGYTGAGGAWPSYPDVMAWTEGPEGDGNTALRLPPDVIGIDVDCYDGKQGAATMADAVAAHGVLPPTWCSTSRLPGSGSGVFLYRVPDHALGLAWPGQVGPDVEIIQTRHRYMVVPPSMHPEGREYRWLANAELSLLEPLPSPDRLPPLPDAWITGLTGGRYAVDLPNARAAGSLEVREWLKCPASSRPPCRIMLARLERITAELVHGGSRHDIATRATMAFAHLAAEGHTGAVHALRSFREPWLTAVTSAGHGQRTPAEAAAEWDRLLAGAVGLLSVHGAAPPGGLPDPCADPFAGILAPEGRLIERVSEQGATGSSVVTSVGAYPSAEHGATGQHMPDPADPFSVSTHQPGSVESAADTVAAPDGSSSSPDGSTDDSGWDRHAVAVSLEVERLRVRADARIALEAEDFTKNWHPPASFTLKELLELPDEPLTWRVDEVMPSGANVTLTSQYKTGKTTMVNSLVRALADAIPFLGVYGIGHSATVAVWNYEVGQAQYVRWLRDIGVENPDRVNVLNLRGFRLPLALPRAREWAVEWLAEREISVWVLDPFARAFTGDENVNAEVGPFLELLDEIKSASGVSELVIPVHTGRATAEPGSERARGATRLDDWTDVRWLLTRGGGSHGGGNGGDDAEAAVRYFRASGRDVETEEGQLAYDPLTRALTLTGGSRAARGRQTLEDAILEAVAAHPGLGLAAIRAAVRERGHRIGNAKIDDALRRIGQQGLLSTLPGILGQSNRHYPARPPKEDHGQGTGQGQ